MTGAPATATTSTDEPDPRRWRALSVTLMAGFMSLLDVSIVSVALPSIRAGLGTDPAAVQWIVSGYALAFGLALVPAGRLGDAFGRRRVFLAALTAFVACSAAAGAAPTTELLIASRLLQGLAAGFLAPQSSGLIQQMFTGAERGRAFGSFGAVVGVSTAIGPVVGGLLLALFGDAQGWRAVFFVNVPIGLVALVLAARLLPRGGGAGRTGRIDVLGVVLLGGGVLAVLLPLVAAGSGGGPWWLAAVGAALLAGFWGWERRVVAAGHPPLLDVRLFTDVTGYASGAGLATVYFVGFSGIWLVFALHFQNGLGYTPLESGLAVTPFALGSAASAVVGGRLVPRWGRTLTVVGLALVVVGLGATALVLLLAPPPVAAWTALPLLVGGVGGGWVISPNTTMTLREVPVRMAGAAGGALQTGQRIGSAVGTAALTAVLYTVLAATGGAFPVAGAAAIGVATLLVAVALGIAVAERSADRHRAAADRAGQDAGHGGEHAHHHADAH